MAQSDTKKLHINGLQWVTLIFSLLIIAATVLYLSWAIYRDSGAPPAMEFTTVKKPASQQYIYEVRMKNIGEQAAQNIQVQYALHQQGREAQTGAMVFDFAPAGSEQIGWIQFQTEPKPDDTLKITSVSFIKP